MGKYKYLVVVILFLLTGFADHVSLAQAANIQTVGFWYGLWHGYIFPVAWIVSLLNDSVAIYAIYNNGGWYDFGFIIGAHTTLGPIAASRGER